MGLKAISFFPITYLSHDEWERFPGDLTKMKFMMNKPRLINQTAVWVREQFIGWQHALVIVLSKVINGFNQLDSLALNNIIGNKRNIYGNNKILSPSHTHTNE